MSLDPIREARTREALEAWELDALICRLPENVLVLTGYWPLSSFAFVVYPREGPAALLAVETEVDSIPEGAVETIRTFPWGVVGATNPYGDVQRHLRDLIVQAGAASGRIGFEGGFEAVAPGHMAGEVMVPAALTLATIRGAAPEATLIDATAMIHRLRARKTPTEIAGLRLANEIAALGLAAFREAYEPGRIEAEVAARVEAAILGEGIGYKGARHARAWSQLMSGPASARAFTPHPATSARRIERGDVGLLELAVVVDGYWSDLTRTLVAGTPTERQREIYDVLLAAHGATMRTALPGMTGAEIDAAARTEVERRGHGAAFLHHTGHGLGFRYHEPHPFLHPANREVIEEGMVSSIEPGIYIEGYGGFRLEENVVFTESGAELLSVFDTSLSTA
jgi:Xaa-Pro dipeptidase